MSCIDGVVVSVSSAQTCEEACNGECCIGPGAYDGYTVGVCWDSARYSGEGGCRNACINGVFLGCECSRGSQIEVCIACFLGFGSRFVMVLLCRFFV